MENHTYTCDSRVRHCRTRASPKIEGRKLRHLDLRKVECYENFGATTFTYQVDEDEEAVNLTTHRGDTRQRINFAKRTLTNVLREAIRDAGSRVKDHRAIVHIYLTCRGLDRDFVFNRSGPEKMTLRNLLKSNRNIEEVVDEFSRIIQSGKDVILESGCTLRLCVYEPPDGWIDSDDEPEYADDEDYHRMRTYHNNYILTSCPYN